MAKAKDQTENVWGQTNPSPVKLAVPLNLHVGRQGRNNPCGVHGMASAYAQEEGVHMTQGRCKKSSNAMTPFLKGGYGRHTRKSG